jgi:2-dehydropantoate 2-reductase
VEPVHIVGAGGIGCAVGYALCAAGLRPLFIDNNPHKVRWGNAHGVQLGRFAPLPARFQSFDGWRPEPRATVLLCTKCYHNATVLPRVPAMATVIPIQNGFDAALSGNGDGIEGIAAFVSECDPDRTRVRLTRGGALYLGWRQARADRADGLLAPLAARLRRFAPFRTYIVPNILPYKYAKLMYNAAINPLAAMARLDNGELLAVPAVRRLFFALLSENYGILEQRAIPLARIGPLHPGTVRRILSRTLVADWLAWFFYPTLRGSYCSMSSDLPHGRTEIEFFNRHLIDLAGSFPCPLNRRVYELVKSMERDRTPLGIGRLKELL